MPCLHSTREYFYSVYTNKRICRHCWTDEAYDPEAQEPMTQMTATALAPATDLIDNMIVAMARVSEESVKVEEAIAEFVAAHEQAQAKGIGVVVCRNRDGSTTSTPNVFVKPGTIIFMDEPGDWSQSLRETGYRFPVEEISEAEAA